MVSKYRIVTDKYGSGGFNVQELVGTWVFCHWESFCQSFDSGPYVFKTLEDAEQQIRGKTASQINKRDKGGRVVEGSDKSPQQRMREWIVRNPENQTEEN